MDWQPTAVKEDPRLTAAIDAAHPLKTGRHDLYQQAMELVGCRRDKGDLVMLVNWLLYECACKP